MPANSFLKSTYFNLITPIALAIATGIGLTARPGYALTFNFNSASDVDSRALEGFIAAGNFWSEKFTDDVTINIKIGFEALDDGVLSIADSTRSS